MTQQFGSDQRRAFLAAPNPQRYFAAGAIEEARQRIARSIARREGPALVIGATGTGKSLLLAVLAEQFAPRAATCGEQRQAASGEPSRAVVTLAGAQLCTRRALLQMILCELDLPYRGMDEGELRLSILQYLRGDSAKPRAAAAPRQLLLLVDEADALPVRLLEELRVLTNAACEGLPLVSLVLAGGPTLEERFADPQLETFSQRLAARTYLAPFGREETFQYVAAQVAAARIQPEALFAPDALEAIHAATHGVPRLINQLGDQLAWMAEETGCAPLDSALVQQAWSDLQQLPAPWNTADHPAARPSGGVIEFGDLDGEGSYAVDTGDAEPPAADLADDQLASISIAAARAAHARCDDELDPTDDPTELLLDRRDDRRSDDLIATHPIAQTFTPAQPVAHDPFAECFAAEEVLLDPYAALKAELMRTAPQVINRLDRAFAADLDRCIVEVEAAKGTDASRGLARFAQPAEQNVPAPLTASRSKAELAHIRLHDLASAGASAAGDGYSALENYGELLVIEDDDRPAASIVAGRQFRRLFSCLESTAGRSLLG